MLVTTGEFQSTGEPYAHARRHGLDCTLTGILLGGEIEMVSGGERRRRPAPSLSLIRPNVTYRFHTVAPQHRFANLWVAFRPWPALAPRLTLPEVLPGVGWIRLAEHPHGEAIVEAYRDVLAWWRSPRPGGRELAQNRLEHAWLLVGDGLATADGIDDERLSAVVRHVRDHLEERLSVEALARVATLSPSRFAHRFREAMGTAPMDYVEAVRMEEAKSLLLGTDWPVKRIARRVGFENPYHFSTRFRHRVGRSPSSFRDAPSADG